eukprot:g4480.t1
MAARAAATKLGPSALVLTGGIGYGVGKFIESGGGETEGTGASFVQAIAGILGALSGNLSNGPPASRDSADTNHGAGRDDLARRMDMLSMQVQQLAGQKSTVVVSALPSGEAALKGTATAGLATVGIVAYCWYRGIGLADVAYVSKRNFTEAIAGVKATVVQVRRSLGRLREEVLVRFGLLEKKVDNAVERLEGRIDYQVKSVRDDIGAVASSQGELKDMVGDLSTKVSAIEQQTRFSSEGIKFLCDFVHTSASGKMALRTEDTPGKHAVLGLTRFMSEYGLLEYEAEQEHEAIPGTAQSPGRRGGDEAKGALAREGTNTSPKALNYRQDNVATGGGSYASSAVAPRSHLSASASAQRNKTTSSYMHYSSPNRITPRRKSFTQQLLESTDSPQRSLQGDFLDMKR